MAYLYYFFKTKKAYKPNTTINIKYTIIDNIKPKYSIDNHLIVNYNSKL